MIWWAVLLFLLGMSLLLAEFVLPGGILGVFGILLLLGSMGLGAYNYPDLVLFILVGEGIAAGVCVLLGILVISRTGAARSLMLETSQRAEDGYTNLASDTSLLGQVGVVYTALRPSGTILLEDRKNERVDAVTEGVFVQEGGRVRIIEVHGNRVVVEPLTET